jgi:hypothetical protein
MHQRVPDQGNIRKKAPGGDGNQDRRRKMHAMLHREDGLLYLHKGVPTSQPRLRKGNGDEKDQPQVIERDLFLTISWRHHLPSPSSYLWPLCRAEEIEHQGKTHGEPLGERRDREGSYLNPSEPPDEDVDCQLDHAYPNSKKSSTLPRPPNQKP